MGRVYDEAFMFKKKYSKTIAWRLRKHSSVIEGYLNPGEEVKYVFCGQRNLAWYQMSSTVVIALTNKRLLVGQKNLFFGSRYTQVTPDMYNDMEIYSGLIWGSICIDTVKEEIFLSNIDKKALDEIETEITEFMMKEKKKFVRSEHSK